MPIKKLFFVTLATSLAVLWMGSIALAVYWYKQPITTITELNEVCQKNLGKDGLANITIGSVNFQNQTGQLTVPCSIHIRPGSTFQMNKVSLETKRLEIISADSNNSKKDRPIHIVLRYTKLTGREDAFQVDGSAPGTTVVIRNSTIDYPSLIGIGVGSTDKDTKSQAELTDNIMRSMNPDGEGIWIVSTGRLIVKNNRFELSDPSDYAVLLGNTCQIQANSHANQSCQAAQ